MNNLIEILKIAKVSPQTIKAMSQIDRKNFIPKDQPYSIANAYKDVALSIGHGVTISQPSLVGKMIDLLQVEPTSNILELGTGSAYNAAILGKLLDYKFGGGTLTTVERIGALARRARLLLKKKNIKVIHGDAVNYKYNNKFDRIIVTAEFLNQHQIEKFVLKNSSLFAICVYPFGGWLWRIIKMGDEINKEKIIKVKFVPVIESKI